MKKNTQQTAVRSVKMTDCGEVVDLAKAIINEWNDIEQMEKSLTDIKKKYKQRYPGDNYDGFVRLAFSYEGSSNIKWVTVPASAMLKMIEEYEEVLERRNARFVERYVGGDE